ncbi:Mu-like prophage major head subunit gpT family protein [Pseudomonas sp. F1_0610]|uniref:Mu-like prophage major head subunit gpT family protein n=1 Tax=Pseudomonas sp. F1_0610 TaxID=3114284 RepID=UPI0039C18D76
MAIITAALLQSLRVGFQKYFQDGLEQAPSEYTKIATVIKSTTASNTYGWLGQFPALREWIGARVVQNMKEHGYNIVNKLWESTVGVKRTDIEDDNLGIYGPLFIEAGRASNAHPDIQVFSLLAKGDSNLCYDGQNFFDTEHPVYPEEDGTGTPVMVSNLFAGTDADAPAWFLLDTSRALKPLIYQERIKPNFTALTGETDAVVFNTDEYQYGIRARNNVGYGLWQLAAMSTLPLNAENFEKVYDAMRALKADGGRPLNVKATVLVVPTTLRAAAKKVVGTALLPGGGDNPNYGLVDVLDVAWLNK